MTVVSHNTGLPPNSKSRTGRGMGGAEKTKEDLSLSPFFSSSQIVADQNSAQVVIQASWLGQNKQLARLQKLFIPWVKCELYQALNEAIEVWGRSKLFPAAGEGGAGEVIVKEWTPETPGISPQSLSVSLEMAQMKRPERLATVESLIPERMGERVEVYSRPTPTRTGSGAKGTPTPTPTPTSTPNRPTPPPQVTSQTQASPQSSSSSSSSLSLF